MKWQDERDFDQVELAKAECQNCVFWSPLSDIHGECRRYPPQPSSEFMGDGFTRKSLFSTTSHRHWCGEFVEF